MDRLLSAQPFLPEGSQGLARPAGRQTSSSSLRRVPGHPWGLLSVGHARNTSLCWHPNPMPNSHAGPRPRQRRHGTRSEPASSFPMSSEPRPRPPTPLVPPLFGAYPSEPRGRNRRSPASPTLQVEIGSELKFTVEIATQNRQRMTIDVMVQFHNEWDD